MSDPRSGSTSNPWEELIVLVVGASAAAALLTVATWHKLLAFLVDQQLLVPASRSPLVDLPAGNGVGLDAPRLAIVAAVLAFGLVLLVGAIRGRDQDERSQR